MSTIDWKKPIQLRVQAYADDTETRKDKIYKARLLGRYGDVNNPRYAVVYQVQGHDDARAEMCVTSDQDGHIQRGTWVENKSQYRYSGAWFGTNYKQFFHGAKEPSLESAVTLSQGWQYPALFFVKWDEEGNVIEIILAHEVTSHLDY